MPLCNAAHLDGWGRGVAARMCGALSCATILASGKNVCGESGAVRRTVFLRGSSALIMAVVSGWGQVALAQEEARANTSGSGIADIVVTANRRAENAQTVPVAVTAVTGEQMRELGISSGADLNGKVPSVFVTSGGNQRNVEVVVIRGQGQTYLSPVGVVNYFNDVPLIQGGITAIQGAPGMFFDLESMQVLRGPQGTLFGRNTTGGAVLLGPKRPTNEFDGYVQAQIGNYKDREFEGAVNVPLIDDKLMVRAAFKKVDRDGYTKDVGPQAYGLSKVCAPPALGTLGSCTVSNGFAGKDYDDRHYWHARIGILARPVEGVENYLVAYYAKSHDNGSGFIPDDFRSHATGNPYDLSVATISAMAAYNVNNPGAPIGFTGAGIYAANQLASQILARQATLGPRKTAVNSDTFEKTKSWGIVNTLSIDVSDALQIKSITGYQRLKQNYNWDLDGSILPILAQTPPFATPAASAEAPDWLVGNPGDSVNVANSSLFTQELQLQGSALDRKLQFVVGGFYSKQKPEGLQATGSFNAASANPGTFYAITSKAQAVFGQATLDMGAFTPGLDGLKLTAGIRRTWDKIDGSRYASNFVLDPVVLHRKLKSAATTWTVGVDYQVNNGLMLYGKVARGYKAGAFNYAGADFNQITAKPEYVTSYEIGFKSDFELGTVPVRFNANAFHVDYDGIQRAAAMNHPNGCDTTIGSAPGSEPARCDLIGNVTGLDQGAVTFNAGKARMRGIELELVVQPVEGLRISGSYSYIDAKYKTFIQNVSGSGLETRIDTCQGEKQLIYGVPQALDFSCIPFQVTPKNLININARYEVPLGDSVGTLAFGANYSWVDRIYNGSTTTPRDDIHAWMESYGKLDLSLEWQDVMGSNFDLRLFGTNVTDKTYRTNAYTGLRGASGFTQSLYGEPRMYGASLRYRFGASGN